jgi:hypothetical protein
MDRRTRRGLPYRREALEGAQLTVTASLQACGEQSAILTADAAFADDPSGSPTWIQLRITAHGGFPLAIAYRVVALVAPEAVAT